MQIACVWNGLGAQITECFLLANYVQEQKGTLLIISSEQVNKMLMDCFQNVSGMPYSKLHKAEQVDEVYVFDSSKQTYQIAKQLSGKRIGLKSSLLQSFSKSVSIKKFQDEQEAIQELFSQQKIPLNKSSLIHHLSKQTGFDRQALVSDHSEDEVKEWVNTFPSTMEYSVFYRQKLSCYFTVYTDWSYAQVFATIMNEGNIKVLSSKCKQVCNDLNIPMPDACSGEELFHHYTKLSLPNRQHTSEAIERLKRGEVVLMNTDTVPGLHALARNETAVDTVYSIKQRPKEKRCIILVSGIQMLKEFNHSVPQEFIEYEERHKTATTLLIKAGWGVPEYLQSDEGLIAIRIPVSERLRKLIEIIGEPIISTSANISGSPNPTQLTEVAPEISQSGIMVFQEEFADSPSKGKASRIIQILEDKLRVIRE